MKPFTLGKNHFLPPGLLTSLALIADVSTTKTGTQAAMPVISRFEISSNGNEVFSTQSKEQREHDIFSPKRFELIAQAEAEMARLAQTTPQRLYGDLENDPSRTIVETPKGYVVNLQHLHQVLLNGFPNTNRLANFISAQIDNELAANLRIFEGTNTLNRLSDEIIQKWINLTFNQPENVLFLETMIDKLIERGPFGLVDKDSIDRRTFRDQLRFLRYSGLDIKLDKAQLTNIHIRSMAGRIIQACQYHFDPEKVLSILYGSRIATPSRVDLLRIIVCLREAIDTNPQINQHPTKPHSIAKVIELLKIKLA